MFLILPYNQLLIEVYIPKKGYSYDQVIDLNPLGDSSPKSLTALAGTMFFAADDGSQGEELWKSDGTAQGTQLVLDIAAVGGSSPSELIVVDGTLFFTADDGNLGRELWMIKPLSGSQDWQRYD